MFPFDPWDTQQWPSGSPSASLGCQCLIHLPETLPPLFHATGPGPTMAFQWASHQGIWRWAKTLQALQSPSTFQKEISMPATLVSSPWTRLYHAPPCALALALLAWNILSDPSWLPTTIHCSMPRHVQLHTLLILAPSLHCQCLDIRNCAVNMCWPDNFECICSTGQHAAFNKGLGLEFCLKSYVVNSFPRFTSSFGRGPCWSGRGERKAICSLSLSLNYHVCKLSF